MPAGFGGLHTDCRLRNYLPSFVVDRRLLNFFRIFVTKNGLRRREWCFFHVHSRHRTQSEPFLRFRYFSSVKKHRSSCDRSAENSRLLVEDGLRKNPSMSRKSPSVAAVVPFSSTFTL